MSSPDQETLALALKIADEAAEATITCEGAFKGNINYRNGVWYKVTGNSCPDTQTDLDLAVRYLDLRGKLVRYPGEPSLVRPFMHDEEEAAQ